MSLADPWRRQAGRAFVFAFAEDRLKRRACSIVETTLKRVWNGALVAIRPCPRRSDRHRRIVEETREYRGDRGDWSLSSSSAGRARSSAFARRAICIDVTLWTSAPAGFARSPASGRDQVTVFEARLACTDGSMPALGNDRRTRSSRLNLVRSRPSHSASVALIEYLPCGRQKRNRGAWSR